MIMFGSFLPGLLVGLHHQSLSGSREPTLSWNQLHSLESSALTHLESIGLGNAAFISMGGPQAHGNSQPGLDLAIHAVHIASVRHRTLDEQREKFRLDEVAC